MAERLGHIGNVLATAGGADPFADAGAGGLVDVRPLQGFLEQRAGVGQQQVTFAIFDRAGVGQGENRLAAVALASRHRADGAGGRDGGLRGVADAVAPDPFDDRVPVQRRAAPIVHIRRERRGWLPFEILRIVDAALDRQERAAFLRQLDARQHAVVADEFHDLGRELLALRRAVAHAQRVHQVAQPHDAQADTAGAQGRFA